MVGGSLLRRAKKVVHKGGSSRGESSKPTDYSSTLEHPYSSKHVANERSESHRQSFHAGEQTPNSEINGIWFVDNQGTSKRRRWHTTCVDIQNFPPSTRVHIEVNEYGVPCNISESTLLGSYMGVIVKDPILAPISFADWHNKGMGPFKKKMLAEIESKFDFPPQIRAWILQSLGVKWRNYKTNLKAEHWDNRVVEEILECVPTGVDAAQWCQFVTQWLQSEDQAIQDKLLLWKINRTYKDGSWLSEEARQRWMQACEILGAQGLTPEDENKEENEKVLLMVMGPEHSGQVQTAGFEVTPSKFFPQSTTNSGEGSTSSTASTFGRFASLQTNIQSLRTEINDMQTFMGEMRNFMQHMTRNFPPPGGSKKGVTDQSTND